MTDLKSDTDETFEKSSGWRGSREIWLDAAKQTLIESGIGAVKIQPLAARLDIARTSFYWFFKDRNALLDAILEEWEAKNTGAFVAACETYAETISEAVLNLITVFQDEALFEPQLDFAIRSWAHQSDVAAEHVHKADKTRITAIRAMFERFGFKSDEAEVRALTVYLTQIGYISMQITESRDIRMARVAGYVRTFSGESPTRSEMARFFSHMKYKLPENTP